MSCETICTCESINKITEVHTIENKKICKSGKRLEETLGKKIIEEVASNSTGEDCQRWNEKEKGIRDGRGEVPDGNLATIFNPCPPHRSVRQRSQDTGSVRQAAKEAAFNVIADLRLLKLLTCAEFKWAVHKVNEFMIAILNRGDRTNEEKAGLLRDYITASLVNAHNVSEK